MQTHRSGCKANPLITATARLKKYTFSYCRPKNSFLSSHYRPRHLTWEKCYDSLTVTGLHENWTLALRCQVSAQPPAKKTAGQIEMKL
jgi:hypothetical protein